MRLIALKNCVAFATAPLNALAIFVMGWNTARIIEPPAAAAIAPRRFASCAALSTARPIAFPIARNAFAPASRMRSNISTKPCRASSQYSDENSFTAPESTGSSFVCSSISGAFSFSAEMPFAASDKSCNFCKSSSVMMRTVSMNSRRESAAFSFAGAFVIFDAALPIARRFFASVSPSL